MIGGLGGTRNRYARAATYVFAHDDNYVQPNLAADHGALHLEGRYNYESRGSPSGFVGWNFETGSAVTLELTPMIGAVGGAIHGVIPAVELTLGFRRLEFSAEGEYVMDLKREGDSFLYSWSEFSVHATDWLRAGIVTQRTRAFHQPRNIERGLLAGVAVRKVEIVGYFVEPGSNDRYFIGSVSVSF